MTTRPEPILPPALRPGDTVAVVSPSCPGAAFLHNEMRRGVQALRDMGFQARLMPNAQGRSGWVSGSVQQRLDDLHQAFLDPTVGAVLYSMGGNHSAQLLQGLDFDLIAAHPKVFCGYSDATTLLTAVSETTGLVTFYGPALIPQFGELPVPYPETVEHFLRVVTRPEAAGPCPVIPYQITDLDYARREREHRPRDRSAGPPRRVLRNGTATGPSLVACLPSLPHLLGTPWHPDTAGRVLFLETPEPPYSVADADADLWHLRNAGVFADVAAVVVGRTIGWTAREVSAFDEALLACLPDRQLPVLVDLEFGHTNPIITIPNRVETLVDGTNLTITAPAVR